MFIALAVLLAGWTALSTFRTVFPNPRPWLDAATVANGRIVRIRDGGHRPFNLILYDAPVPKGVVVACHGYSRMWQQLAALSARLAEQGWTVILHDSRGHGSRRRLACTFGWREAEDVAAIGAWLNRQAALAALPRGLLGWSLGAATVCRAATQDATWRAMIVDSLYARLFPSVVRSIAQHYHLPRMPWAYLTWWGLRRALGQGAALCDPVRVAPQGRQPLLLIHGTSDSTVPLAAVEQIAAAWQGPVERWVVSGAVHAGACALDPSVYVQRVTTFLERWLRCA